MRSREGIVDIDVAQAGHALGQLDIIGFLAGVEAGVFEDQHGA
jgi:hypothetical protein